MRFEAVNVILTSLRQLQLAMLSTEHGPIDYGFKGDGCEYCLDRWFRCLSKGLLRPKSICSSLAGNFPSLFPVINAEEFHWPLGELCALVHEIQFEMDFSPSKNCCRDLSGGGERCRPPHLAGLEAVESLISQGLESPPDVN